jgi:DNA-binding LacI/PurR family transcriptional regulator
MNSDKDSAWVTAADVAHHAGVSRSAVSRTFTEGASVSPDTRAKVLKSAEALGYQVNMLARSMIQQQSNLVGVVVSGFDNPFLLSLLGPLTHALAVRSQAPLLMDASEPEQLSKSLRHLLQYRIAGVILTSGTPPIQLAKEYLRLRIPVAMLNREPSLEGVDVINSDNRQGGTMAAGVLQAAGARELVFLHVPSATHSASERSAAFAQALEPAIKRGAIKLRRVNASGAFHANGFEAARTLLADPAQRPDGVFCTNDALACGLIDGARELFGLRVPEDLKVVGFDDIPMSAYAAYSLTTFRQDVFALADRAVACLAERMGDPDMPSRLLELPVNLVERRSSGPRATPSEPAPAKAAESRRRRTASPV